jgi:hypothetical protein
MRRGCEEWLTTLDDDSLPLGWCMGMGAPLCYGERHAHLCIEQQCATCAHTLPLTVPATYTLRGPTEQPSS